MVPQGKRKSKEKLSKITIHFTEDCKVDPSILPEDAVFKYYDTVVVQDIIITTKNTAYRKEVWYSASQQRTYRGELPHGIEGEFGNGVKSLIITLKHASNQEKADIFKAGLESTVYQQIDDTGTKVNGEKQYVQIICNPFYTAYFTIPTKDRMSILDILQGGKARIYFFNEEAPIKVKISEGRGESKKRMIMCNALYRGFTSVRKDADLLYGVLLYEWRHNL